MNETVTVRLKIKKYGGTHVSSPICPSPPLREFVIEPVIVKTKAALPSVIKNMVGAVLTGMEKGNAPIMSKEEIGESMAENNQSGPATVIHRQGAKEGDTHRRGRHHRGCCTSSTILLVAAGFTVVVPTGLVCGLIVIFFLFLTRQSLPHWLSPYGKEICELAASETGTQLRHPQVRLVYHRRFQNLSLARWCIGIGGLWNLNSQNPFKLSLGIYFLPTSKPRNFTVLQSIFVKKKKTWTLPYDGPK